MKGPHKSFTVFLKLSRGHIFDSNAEYESHRPFPMAIVKATFASSRVKGRFAARTISRRVWIREERFHVHVRSPAVLSWTLFNHAKRQMEPQVRAMELKKLETELAEDSDNFETWEKLVRAAENLEGGINRNSSPQAITTVRSAYDRFLAKFPLLFGYWKKYADLEFSVAGTEAAEMVYERGVASITRDKHPAPRIN
ncbi:hypothetical protein VTN31DRAFT_2928 [Thermomyces dupontii]|uniref:uncharacterized protein n=1 Tax=Talaromyces thermophilus TaxID=28565 RepID=UPI003744AB4C